MRRPGTIQDLPRHRAHDHPPLIIKSRGFLNPLRKRLSPGMIYYNIKNNRYDVARSKHPPHLPTLEAATPILLVTVCTKYRREILANPTAHALLREAWQTYNDFPVGRYVILPNHIHLLVGDSDVAPYSLARWVCAWKAYVSRRWPKEEDKPIWQRSFWDRQMWSDHACDVKWLYVRNNPVRHGLVKHPDDWPFQGGMHV